MADAVPSPQEAQYANRALGISGDPTFARMHSALNLNPDEQRWTPGSLFSLLPVAKSITSGKLSLAVPQALRDWANDVVSMVEGTRTGTVDPFAGATIATAAMPASAMLENVTGDALGMFLGRNAKNVDQAALRRAEVEHAAGVEPEKTLDETRWFQGPDQQWRTEIADDKSRLQPPAFDRLKQEPDPDLARMYSEAKLPAKMLRSYTEMLPQAIYHPEIFQQYPQLADVRVSLSINPLRKTPKGSYDPVNNVIEVEGPDIDGIHSVLLHETQHAIQKIEGFAPGGDPREIRSSSVPEVKQRFTDALRDAMADHPLLDPTRAGDWQEYLRTGVPSGKLGAEINRAMEKAVWDAGYEVYRNLTGETEARLVQTRRDLDPAMQKIFIPWLTKLPAERVKGLSDRPERWWPPDLDGKVRNQYGPDVDPSKMITLPREN